LSAYHEADELQRQDLFENPAEWKGLFLKITEMAGEMMILLAGRR
jgi:hypothetical protein